MPEPIDLLASSGDERIDRTAAGVVGVLELSFAGRIRGYYFEGSCADSAITSLSDIDLCALFVDKLSTGERERFLALAQACKRISARSLDLSCTDEATVLQADRLRFGAGWAPVLHAVTLKYASRPIYGTDVRATIPDVPHDVYRRTLMHFPFEVLAGQRPQLHTLPYPLPFLDPSDEFYGYTGRRLYAPDGTLQPSTKRLSHSCGFIATALLAYRTELYIADKRSATVAYRTQIGDVWADHLDDVHRWCRVQWGYRVPETPRERERLQAMCRRELAFENHYLNVYQEFLAQEEAAADPEARSVAEARTKLLDVRPAPCS